jgi:hypothetical protein
VTAPAQAGPLSGPLVVHPPKGRTDPHVHPSWRVTWERQGGQRPWEERLSGESVTT